VDEGRLAGRAADGLEQVQSAARVGVEVVERDLGGQVVRGPGRRVDDGVRPDLGDQADHSGPVADVQVAVGEAPQRRLEALLIPACIALRAEVRGARVVVDAVDLPAQAGEVRADLRADRAGGTGYKEPLYGAVARTPRPYEPDYQPTNRKSHWNSRGSGRV
jgi:hypothetical protein